MFPAVWTLSPFVWFFNSHFSSHIPCTPEPLPASEEVISLALGTPDFHPASISFQNCWIHWHVDGSWHVETTDGFFKSNPPKKWDVCVQSLSVQLFVTPWAVACQVPLSMEFFRQEYWSGFHSRGSSWHKDQTHVSCIGRWILYHWATKEARSGTAQPKWLLFLWKCRGDLLSLHKCWMRIASKCKAELSSHLLDEESNSFTFIAEIIIACLSHNILK